MVTFGVSSWFRFHTHGFPIDFRLTRFYSVFGDVRFCSQGSLVIGTAWPSGRHDSASITDHTDSPSKLQKHGLVSTFRGWLTYAIPWVLKPILRVSFVRDAQRLFTQHNSSAEVVLDGALTRLGIACFHTLRLRSMAYDTARIKVSFRFSTYQPARPTIVWSAMASTSKIGML